MAENKQDNHELDAKFIKKIQDDLLERKAQILKDLDGIGSETNTDDPKLSFPEYGDKSDENAQEINEYGTNLATEQVLDKTLRDIENTLKRIEDGEYGKCKYCGKTIAQKRLEARPVASACIECKTQLQKNGQS